MRAKQIAPGLHAIPVGMVNVFLLEQSDGCALIDTGFPGSADKILQAIREIGLRPSDIRHIILTHAHPDHIGSLAAMKKATGAQAYMHARDAEIATAGGGFRSMRPAPGSMNAIMFRMFVRPIARVEAAVIEHLVDDRQVLPIAGGLTLFHVPGHCAGQVALHWPRHGGVLFAADSCSNMMGLGLTLGYEDLEEGRHSLQKLARLHFQIACFGHGKAILHDAAARFRAKWL